MKKILIIFSLVISFNVSAQMVDLLSGMAIQGQMTAQSVGQIKTGFSLIQQNELIRKINLILMEARMVSNKENIKKSIFSYDLSPLKWDILPYNNGFALIFENIDKQFCSKLSNSLQYKTLFINQKQKKECEEVNNLKFIF